MANVLANWLLAEFQKLWMILMVCTIFSEEMGRIWR